VTTIRSLAPVPHLLGSDPYGIETLDCYRAAGGYTRIDPQTLLARVDASGLRGRGGAAFPLTTKLRSVIASATATRLAPVVVANGEEGEPGSVKDRQLMRTRPHLILDGLAHAAAIIGADRAYAYVSDHASADALAEALDAYPPVVPTTVVRVDPAYVAGEETAVVRFLDGGPALPVAKPPRPYERGVGGAPTLTSNVETLAHLARLASGVDSTANLLLTIGGSGIEPALVEVTAGTRLRAILAACGWWHATGALMGGLFGGVSGESILDTPVSADALRAAGSALGCGAIHLLAPDDCPVDLAVDALAYLAAESALQCGVCISATAALATTAAALRTGAATAEDLAKIERWVLTLPGRGACGLLDAAARVAGSLLAGFRPLVDTHLDGTCRRCATGHRSGAGRLIVDIPTCHQLTTR
jgi:NADH:ubiquinone oxidoreductase subunit F (NADH-binding)